MKYALLAVVAILAFGAGQLVSWRTPEMPSVPVAFVQAINPVVITIDVDLKQPISKSRDDNSVLKLEGTAEYRFTNTSDEPISIALPPDRTFGIGRNHLNKDWSCPAPLKDARVLLVPPRGSMSLRGEWQEFCRGDVDTFLEAGPGPYAFKFSTPKDADPSATFCNETLIAFTAYRSVKPLTRLHTIDGHLDSIARLRQVVGD